MNGSVFQKHTSVPDANCSASSSSSANSPTASSCTANTLVPGEEYPSYSIVFQCPDGALDLNNCPYVFANSCESGKDAGVICPLPCEDDGVRLIGGSTELEGNVQVCVNGVWGKVCDPNWGAAEAKVTCTSLGYSKLGMNAISCIKVFLPQTSFSLFQSYRECCLRFIILWRKCWTCALDLY